MTLIFTSSCHVPFPVFEWHTIYFTILVKATREGLKVNSIPLLLGWILNLPLVQVSFNTIVGQTCYATGVIVFIFITAGGWFSNSVAMFAVNKCYVGHGFMKGLIRFELGHPVNKVFFFLLFKGASTSKVIGAQSFFSAPSPVSEV